MRINAYTIVKAEYFYEWEYNYLCIDTHTPYVAATSFFAGEVEIFDFVTERVKRCIAAKMDEGFGEIFYGHSVVCRVVYCTHMIYGGRTHSACRYGCV